LHRRTPCHRAECPRTIGLPACLSLFGASPALTPSIVSIRASFDRDQCPCLRVWCIGHTDLGEGTHVQGSRAAVARPRPRRATSSHFGEFSQSGHVDRRPSRCPLPVPGLPAQRTRRILRHPGIRHRDTVCRAGHAPRPHARLPSHAALRCARLFSTVRPVDAVLVHTSLPRGDKVSLGIEVNILPAAIEQVRPEGAWSSPR